MVISFKEVKDFPRDKKTMVEYQDKGDWFGEYIDNKLVGICNLSCDGKIKSVYVLTEYRHQGIGNKLIKEALDLSLNKYNKCHTLALDSSKQLFLNNNFEIVSVRECKFGNVYNMKYGGTYGNKL